VVLRRRLPDDGATREENFATLRSAFSPADGCGACAAHEFAVSRVPSLVVVSLKSTETALKRASPETDRDGRKEAASQRLDRAIGRVRWRTRFRPELWGKEGRDLGLVEDRE
jgi:hypothetical protein